MSVQGQRVLLVDDDKAIRTVLHELLQFSGYEVIDCSDANEALSVLDRGAGAISLMIADHAIPGMSGIALARDVARTAPWIRTLIISGHRSPEAECRRIEGAAFLSKPFGSSDVLNAMRQLALPQAKRSHSVPLRKPEIKVAL
jgi:DNA-binding NtrC family response regulator